ncbi:putative transcription repressor PLATZ family [Helianthus annuus]|uniref:Transcription repressor PLATZ family n=1 Tax=Helianthus annuus TaxID=4232 RepID=A0A9K3HF84_HELAN|nr:putative transcription repressor PLATZ family [Helianthus annuus]KAJ0504646.1 putative transcription repressor PLATZ family [Helianthus annuus]KAJ0674373.1 putative transcription repressor PLATZ family [Helianthus annuus]KAJ0677759.1 putative transcription repressor PLATZ family [Helianthus annuus]KAJ0725001.1 putative transcription repressor PLATZ family [Helianthus annuus]
MKIRRYLLHEVINRPDFQKYFDCSGIQGYQTNKNKVLFLKSRKDNQQQQNNKDRRCNICNQNLLDASYCSIQCKVF